MSRQDSANWGTARLLFGQQLLFLVIVWAVIALGVAAIVLGVANFGRVTSSGWDLAGGLMRWLAAGYGYYLTRRVLPVHVAHGQSRRGYLAQAGLFLGVAGVMLAGLMTLGYALERLVYRAVGWPQAVADDRLFTAADQYATIGLTHLVVLLGWGAAGTLLGAGFGRSEGAGVATVPVAIALVVATGFTVGYGGVPILGRLGVLDVSVALAALLGALIVVTGLVLTWAVVRDTPVHPRTA
jgi:hypothetical protein